MPNFIEIVFGSLGSLMSFVQAAAPEALGGQSKAEAEKYFDSLKYSLPRSTNRDDFSVSSRQKNFQERRKSVNDAGRVSCENAFKDYQAALKPALKTEFSEMKLPTGVALKDKPEAQQIQRKIIDILTKTTPKSDAIQSKLDLTLKTIEESSTKHPQDIAGFLKERTTEIIKELVNEQAEKIQEVETLFADHDFQQSLATDLGLKDENLEDFKKQTLESIKKTHEEEKGNLEKNLANTESKLHQEAANERNRIAFLAMLYREAGNKKIIDQLREARDQNQNPDPASLGGTRSEDEDLFKGIDLAAIKEFTTYGLTVSSSEDGKHSIQIPDYWFGSDIKSREKISALVARIHATRKNENEPIHMTVHTDEAPKNDGKKPGKNAAELARKCYEECIKAGYPENKIVIEVNGVKYGIKPAPVKDEKQPDYKDFSELFGSKSQRMDVAKNIAKEENQKEESFKKTRERTPEAIENLKKMTEAYKAKAAELQAPAQQQSPLQQQLGQ